MRWETVQSDAFQRHFLIRPTDGQSDLAAVAANVRTKKAQRDAMRLRRQGYDLFSFTFIHPANRAFSSSFRETDQRQLSTAVECHVYMYVYMSASYFMFVPI